MDFLELVQDDQFFGERCFFGALWIGGIGRRGRAGESSDGCEQVELPLVEDGDPIGQFVHFINVVGGDEDAQPGLAGKLEDLIALQHSRVGFALKPPVGHDPAELPAAFFFQPRIALPEPFRAVPRLQRDFGHIFRS